jgi:lysophospholipase L1-like esterase
MKQSSTLQLAVLLFWLPTCIAQTPLDVRVQYINNFAAGYDKTARNYRADWVREMITNPRVRPVEAQGCASFPVVSLKQRSSRDEVRTCEDLRLLVAPAGVTKMRWSVIGEHRLTGRPRTIRTKTIGLNPYVHPVGSVCFPTERPIAPKSEDCRFAAELPATATQTGLPAKYTVQLEGLNAANETVASGSVMASAPRSIPVIVSLGDSLASGQGNPDLDGNAKGDWCKNWTTVKMAQDRKPDMHRQPEWLEKRDYRSLKSGAARASRRLLDEWPYIAFITLAKSGAKVSTDEHDLLDQLLRLQRLLGTARIDILHFSIGGNDVGFATTLRTLVTYTGLPIAGGQERPPDFDRLLNVLETNLYPRINSRIAALGLNVGKIAINEYPTSLFNDENNRPAEGCGVFQAASGAYLSISESEARKINAGNLALNSAVTRAAQAHGWHLVSGIAEKFQGRGYCTNSSYWIFAEESCERQGDWEGTVHPNATGTDVVATALAREFRKLLPTFTGVPMTKR